MRKLNDSEILRLIEDVHSNSQMRFLNHYEIDLGYGQTQYVVTFDYNWNDFADSHIDTLTIYYHTNHNKAILKYQSYNVGTCEFVNLSYSKDLKQTLEERLSMFNEIDYRLYK